MNIIFLDIDGVLRTSKSDKEISDLLGIEIPKNVFERDFDKKSISTLNYICHVSRAKVVISSTWRTVYSIQDIRKYFHKNGFTGDIIDYTPIGQNRGDEIVEWLDTNDVNKFVVIDDNINDIKKHVSLKNIIKIDKLCGLNELVIDDILDILL